jgi:hypothetical protein
MVKSPGPKRAMSSSSLAGLRGGAESEREGDPSEKGGDRTVGLETRETDEEGASSRHDWFVAWCLIRPAWLEQIQWHRLQRMSGESRTGI